MTLGDVIVGKVTEVHVFDLFIGGGTFEGELAKEV